ncbi:MAG: hypothetical protein AB201_02905 [Parcubacteria bacterium C7867-006]|nr:MAG: hypothetical protein AB201_02905 [Parcubacteria bacterium C7867-006]
MDINKKIVMEYEELAFNKKDVKAAVEYLHDNFKQHNPQVPDGKEGFINGIGGYLLANNPNLKKEIKRIVVDGDMVAAHSFAKFNGENESERGVAIADFYVIKDGKIAEHWDVIQEIPAETANSNTMF